jgi:hypothetical protein
LLTRSSLIPPTTTRSNINCGNEVRSLSGVAAARPNTTSSSSSSTTSQQQQQQRQAAASAAAIAGWRRPWTTGTLTSEQMEQFWRGKYLTSHFSQWPYFVWTLLCYDMLQIDGYVMVPDLFAKSELTPVLKAIEGLVDKLAVHPYLH